MSSNVGFRLGSDLIRTATDSNGGVWFCVRDIAVAIGHSSPTHMVQSVSQEHVNRFLIGDALGRDQMALFVSEWGLYRILSRSTLPKGKAVLGGWLRSVIEPSIKQSVVAAVNEG